MKKEEQIKNGSPLSKLSKGWLCFLVCFLAISVVLLAIIVCLIIETVKKKNALQDYQSVIAEYNDAITNYNELAIKYNNFVESSPIEDIFEKYPEVQIKSSIIKNDTQNSNSDTIKRETNRTRDEINNIDLEGKHIESLRHELSELNRFAEATIEYNLMVEKYNSNASSYNKQTKITSIEFLDGFKKEYPLLPLASLKYDDIQDSILKGNTIDRINDDVKTLKEVLDIINLEYELLLRITEPSYNLLVNKINGHSQIYNIQRVTNTNDPNQMLGKQGGYVNCIYFSLSSVDSSKIKGTTSIEKGTNGGGAIEIFMNSFDAQNRCDYLSQFDSSILYSGSHVLVGTMVIRISPLLSAEEQYKITREIVNRILS